MADTGTLTIEIDSVDKTSSYIPGHTRKEEGLGGAPNTLEFYTTEEPTERDEIVVQVSWDSAPDELFFGGHIAHVDPEEVGTDGTRWWKVRCLDYRWEADWDYVKARSNAAADADAALTTLTNGLAGAFTTTGIESGGEIDPYKWERVRYTDTAELIARDAAMLFDIDYSRDVRLFGPDAHVSGLHFDRQAAAPNFLRGSLQTKKNVMNMANRIIVEGDEGAVRTVEDTGLQPPILSLIVPVPGVTKGAILNRVGAEYLAARKVTPWSGSFDTFEETLRPGDNIDISDSLVGLSSQTVRVARLVWVERPDQSWVVTVHWTTERMMAAMPSVREPRTKTRKDVAKLIVGDPDALLPNTGSKQRTQVTPPSIVRNPRKIVPAGTDEAIVNIAVNANQNKFTIRLESTKLSTELKLGIGAIIKSRAPITVSVATENLQAGEGFDIFENGTRRVEVATTATGDDANRWTVDEDYAQMEVTVSGDDLENARVVVYLANIEGLDELDAVTLGANTIDTDVAVGRRKKYAFPLQLTVPPGARMGRKKVRAVMDEAIDGLLAQAFKGERDTIAGFLDLLTGGRYAGDVRTVDGVQILIDPDAGVIGAALRREPGGPALRRAFAKASASDADDLDAVPDGTVNAKVLASYLDSNRPKKLRRIASALDIDAEDLFDMTREDLDNISDGTVNAKVLASYLDSNRPKKLRRVTGAVDVDADDVFDTTREDSDDITETVAREFIDPAYTSLRRPVLMYRVVAAEDIDADDISKQAEVENHLGGLNQEDIRDNVLTTELIDRANEEVQNMHVLNNNEIGNPDGKEEPPNAVRAGSVRGLEISESDGDISAYLREGVSAFKVGSTVYGLNINGDGAAITADSAVGESGGGSGDSAGGDRDP